MKKTYTINAWCVIFGLEIIDNDGFRGMDLKNFKIDLATFLEGIISCTIRPINTERYSVLEALI